MAARLSVVEDNAPSPVEEDSDSDEVVVKSKPSAPAISQPTQDDADNVPPSLDSHIDTPPNGGIPSGESGLGGLRTHLIPTLELASEDGGSQRGSESARPWESSEGVIGLRGIFKIHGKRCEMYLEDDHLFWAPEPRGRKGKVDSLPLADIFAVTSLSLRGKQRVQESKRFMIHALVTTPGSSGRLMELVCQPLDHNPSTTCQIWVDYMSQQIQNFGNRPRRLYVIVNPTSRDGEGWSTWTKVEGLFHLAQIHTDVIVTHGRFHARELIQGLNMTQYDGIVVVGGDGTINEVVNGLMLQSQQAAGVNLRRARFVPVQPNIVLGIIPAGFSNTVARSVLGTKCPKEAAAQILLGCVSPMDISSVYHNGQLLIFSVCSLSYGLPSEVAHFTHDFSWLGGRRIDLAQLRGVLSNKDFEGELSYIPVEDHQTIVSSKQKCFSRCPKCLTVDAASVEPSNVVSEKGASVMAATYSNVERVPEQDWKRITGMFSAIIACPLSCRSPQAPQGLSPWAHQANGCTDLIIVRQSSKIELLKWYLRQRRGTTQLDLPYVEIQRVKEFKFREILLPPERAEEEENLVADEREDDDESTNRRGGGSRLGRQQSRDQTIHPTSHWNVDGDDLNRVDIEVRVHRHVLNIFSRGVEPISLDSERENEEVPLEPTSTSNSITSSPETIERSSQHLITS